MCFKTGLQTNVNNCFALNAEFKCWSILVTVMLNEKVSGFHVVSLLFFVGFKQQLKKYSRTCFPSPLSWKIAIIYVVIVFVCYLYSEGRACLSVQLYVVENTVCLLRWWC